MMAVVYVLILSISSFAVCTFFAWGLYLALPKMGIVARPNARGNHDAIVPTGGGLAVAFAASGFLMASGAPASVAFAALLLAVVSFMDDRAGLPVRVRLLAQAVAVALAIGSVVAPGAEHWGLTGGLIPAPIEALVIMLGWMWFTNLFNFMDGIDGIASSQATMMGLGVFVLHLTAPDLSRGVGADSMVIASAAAAFLIFNWHPAKMFMGDAGSIPLGFLVGWLLLKVAVEGYLPAAAILPAYFITDATVTLLVRLMRGERVWEAHSQHAYQKAVRGGMAHDETVRWVMALNLLLLVLAVASVSLPELAIPAVCAAYALCVGLMMFFVSGKHHHGLSGYSVAGDHS